MFTAAAMVFFSSFNKLLLNDVVYCGLYMYMDYWFTSLLGASVYFLCQVIFCSYSYSLCLFYAAYCICANKKIYKWNEDPDGIVSVLHHQPSSIVTRGSQMHACQTSPIGSCNSTVVRMSYLKHIFYFLFTRF